jgi:hypothetical protein
MTRHSPSAPLSLETGRQTASRATRASSQGYTLQCPHCGKVRPGHKASPICTTCHQAVVKRCQIEQELAYLGNWLHSRPELQDRLTRQLRAKAQRHDIDWSTPRPPLAFTQRLAQALAPYQHSKAA